MTQGSNIVLIGMPGAGKSSLGVVVAKELGYDFTDIDLVIQHKYGKVLADLVEELGPEGYIEIENEALCECDCEHSIIATGGSAVYSAEGMAHMKELGLVVYLKAPVEELAERIGEMHQRGVIVRPGVEPKLEAIFADREPLYEQYADLTVETSGTPQDAVEEIVAALQADGSIC